MRSLLVGRANLAITLLQRAEEGDRDEARNLLNLALYDARRLNLPETQQIEQIIEQAMLAPQFDGGTDNIAFLLGNQNTSTPNAALSAEEVSDARPPVETEMPARPPAAGPSPVPSPGPATRGVPGEPGTAPYPGTEADKAEYLVWYGTNRRPNDPRDADKGFSALRDNVVHYGSCRVFIPESHKIGSIGSPWWKRLLTMTDDRLRLIAVDELQQSDYWSGIAARLAAIDAAERGALIFVHGYNVSFEQAALRAAQIGFDLSVKGAMAFFSWPSQGSTRGYPADEATIEASESVIADFMTDFAERSGATAVHIIAHSMGNRGVLRAVNRIAVKAQRRTGKPFGRLFWPLPMSMPMCSVS